MDTWEDTNRRRCGPMPEHMEESIAFVRKTLSSLRVNVVIEEYALHQAMVDLFTEAGISFEKEYKMGPRNRIDFLIEGGIGIEVKKGKPNRRQVIEQLKRYTAFPEIRAVILVVERNITIPGEINGKKCVTFGLNRLWGVALK